MLTNMTMKRVGKLADGECVYYPSMISWTWKEGYTPGINIICGSREGCHSNGFTGSGGDGICGTSWSAPHCCSNENDEFNQAQCIGDSSRWLCDDDGSVFWCYGKDDPAREIMDKDTCENNGQPIYANTASTCSLSSGLNYDYYLELDKDYYMCLKYDPAFKHPLFQCNYDREDVFEYYTGTSFHDTYFMDKCSSCPSNRYCLYDAYLDKLEVDTAMVYFDQQNMVPDIRGINDIYCSDFYLEKMQDNEELDGFVRWMIRCNGTSTKPIKREYVEKDDLEIIGHKREL